VNCEICLQLLKQHFLEAEAVGVERKGENDGWWLRRRDCTASYSVLSPETGCKRPGTSAGAEFGHRSLVDAA
jgi:hypothetical protein